MKRLVLATAVLCAAAAAVLASAPRAEGCAFRTTPHAYEAPRERAAYLLALELASHNRIAANNSFFGTPNVEIGVRGERRIADEPYIPPTLLKAIGWIESALQQASQSVPWAGVGPALVSFDCGHGIMQITSGMTSPAGRAGEPSINQALVATHYLYNIARGAAILVDKWNAAPQVRPIAGTDTDSDPHIVENWYFATWSYNGFTGPGANRSNHPLTPGYAGWPRTGFSCGPADDGYGHNYANYPYQEIVFGCAARPPSVDGDELWEPLDLSLPDLNDDRWAEPLALEHFTTSDWYARMDMPSPQPTHMDATAKPAQGAAAFLRGSPVLRASRNQINGEVNEVIIRNVGDGVLAWTATTGDDWIELNKQGGVALGDDVPCNAPCARRARLTITVNEPKAGGWVDIESLTTGQVWRVAVVTGIFDVNCDEATNTIDALLVLQLSAALLSELPCPERADTNGNGLVDAVDAAIILQLIAGIIDPPVGTPTPAPTRAPTRTPTAFPP